MFVDDGGARVFQSSALYSEFLKNPFIGSGIGGVTDVIRSEGSPWVYELTYMQMLFNFGIIGSVCIVLTIAYTIYKIKNNSRRVRSCYSVVDRSMLSGAMFLLFGAATNPYLGSFDFLLIVGVFPFIASIGVANSSGATRRALKK